MSAAIVTKYPWTAAFAAFCNGQPIEEISAMFSIPLGTLQRRASDETWHKLRAELPLGVPDVVLKGSGEAKLALIQQTRDKALSVFQKLYIDLEKTAAALAAGTLRVKKTFVLKGSKEEGQKLITVEVEPSYADKLTIATYARTVADGAYRAVGDFASQGGKSSDSGGATPNLPTAPAITIILPAAIARPREERQATDVETISVKVEPSKHN